MQTVQHHQGKKVANFEDDKIKHLNKENTDDRKKFLVKSVVQPSNQA
jgi:hypothetical protein